jgi:holo-[acyl-carrier protein] synthase
LTRKLGRARRMLPRAATTPLGRQEGRTPSPSCFAVNTDTHIQVGLDLVQIKDIASSVSHFGDRFLRRIFTDEELRYCMAAPGPSASRLAARFAAKEAARKVLGPDGDALGWRTIEVVRGPSGACDLVLHGEARLRASRAGYVGFSLSMTHESDYASAVVIGERRRGKDAQ